MIWLHDSIAVCLLKSPELHFKTASLPVYVISTYKTYLFLFYPSCLSISTVIWITVPAAETGNRFYTVLNSKILFVALHMSDIDLDVISPPTNNDILELLWQQYFDGEKLQHGIFIFKWFIFTPPQKIFIFCKVERQSWKMIGTFSNDGSTSLSCTNLMCQFRGLVWS